MLRPGKLYPELQKEPMMICVLNVLIVEDGELTKCCAALRARVCASLVAALRYEAAARSNEFVDLLDLGLPDIDEMPRPARRRLVMTLSRGGEKER